MLHPDAASHEPHDFSLVVGGPLYRAYLRWHLAEVPLGLLHRRLLASVLITWVPLWVLSMGSHDTQASVTLLRDIGAHVRLLIALPLLIVAEPIAHVRISRVVRQFIDRGLVAPADLRRFVSAVVSSVKLRNSPTLEAIVLLVAIVGGHWLWAERMSLHIGTWYNEQAADGTTHLSLAGRWYVFVSLPLLRFLALRWLVRLTVVWYRFLWLMARMPLRLNGLHPDRMGGLGFLNNSVFAFLPVLVAQTSVLSAEIALRIWHEGATLPQFKLEILAVVVFLMLLVLLPQTFFTIQLERAWRTDTGEYGVLGSHYVHAFRRKWLGDHPHTRESLIGSPDIQSLADLANSFEVIRTMRLVPITRTTVVRLGLMTVAPLVPLVLTMVPLDTVVDRAIDMLL